MRGYKHIATTLAESFGSATSVRIAPYSFYRKGEKGRADRLEGVAEYFVDRLRPGDLILPEQAGARTVFGLPRMPMLPNLFA